MQVVLMQLAENNVKYNIRLQMVQEYDMIISLGGNRDSRLPPVISYFVILSD